MTQPSQTSLPKVSIITIVHNNEKTIADAIHAVRQQSYEHIEYIVVDGASTDKTLQILQEHQEQIDLLISEKDDGLYDALNKGIRAASGDIIGILHSDDLYEHPQVITEVVQAFQKEDGIKCVYGDLVYVKADNPQKVLRNWKSGGFMPHAFENGWMPPHPTFFVSKETYEEYGLYDTHYKTAADYELMLRYLHKHQLKVAYVPQTLVRMRMGGVSNSSLKHRLAANQEDMQAWKQNGLQPKPYTRFLKPARKLGQLSLSHYGYQSSILLSLFLPFLIMQLPVSGGELIDMSGFQVSLALVFSWGVAAVTVPAVSSIALAKGLVDKPNDRSEHLRPTPTLGGISVFAAILLGLTIWGSLKPNNGLQYIIAALTLIFFTGLKDDVLIIDPVKKLMAQVLAGLILIIGADLRVQSFYGILGIEELPFMVSVVFSLFAYIVVTNAYNLIDGIDGLASGLGTLSALCFGVWFLLTGFTDYAVLAFCLCGALIGFVRYNFSKSEKIFLGDTGSLIIGITVAALAMQFIKSNAIVTGEYHLENAPFIAMAVLGVPLFDTLRVFIIRLIVGQSPFYPDKRHIHHILTRRNPSHLRASFIIIFFSILYVAFTIEMYSLLNVHLALLYLLLSFVLYVGSCFMIERAKPRMFKSFFMRYLPFFYFIFWSRYLRR